MTGASCELGLSFTEAGLGAFAYDCGGGDPAGGELPADDRVAVRSGDSVRGRDSSNSLFTSELTLTNRGDAGGKAGLHLHGPHGEGAAGQTSDVLAPGMQKIETDALTYLTGSGGADSGDGKPDRDAEGGGASGVGGGGGGANDDGGA